MYYKEVKLDFDARSLQASMYLLLEVSYERTCKLFNSEQNSSTKVFFKPTILPKTNERIRFLAKQYYDQIV